MISIDIVSDTVCPWCFIGKRRLEEAMRRRAGYGYRLGWRPFQLNPDLPRGGMERKQYLALKFGGGERARQLHAQLEAAGREERIPFAFGAIRKQPNTFDSHRLIRWAAECGAQDAVVEALFRRYFVDGADIGSRAVLLQVARECGMAEADVRRRLESDADREPVREEELVARRMGVSGVPCFIVDRKYAVSGAQDPSVLVNVFDLAARDAQEPDGRPPPLHAAEDALDA